MPANTTPIFPLTPRIGFITSTSASTATDGTGSTDFFTSGANGSRIDEIRFIVKGTGVQTVARIWLNNGSAIGTSTNNALLYNATIPVSVASNNSEQTPIVWHPDFLTLPANYRLTVAYGTAHVAGIEVIALGGDY